MTEPSFPTDHGKTPHSDSLPHSPNPERGPHMSDGSADDSKLEQEALEAAFGGSAGLPWPTPGEDDALDLPPTNGNGTSVLPLADQLAPPVSCGPTEQPGQLPPFEELPEDLDVVRELARGGMGVVLQGRDKTLEREIAVKVLLGKHHDDSAMQRRFWREAKIAGQLQHPGIVPIYELGKFRDGRPYFTMKLVRGQTLLSLLRQRPQPTYELAKFLTIFEQVCQAVGYAHDRRVIHRDIKPQNIMVGAFGEVQVMDWGLAKVLDAEELGKPTRQDETEPSGAEGQLSFSNDHAETRLTKQKVSSQQADDPDATIHFPLDRGSTQASPDGPEEVVKDGSKAELTRKGIVMGTPTYMPPEQAKGQHREVDERSDVFALGAVLCHILTGSPPYTGSGEWSALVQATRADLSEANKRLDGSNIDSMLIHLAKSCLCPDKQRRPANAGAVAKAMTDYQASVQRRLEQERIARERRKYATVLVCLIVVSTAVAGWFGWRYTVSEAVRREQVRGYLDDVEQMLKADKRNEAGALLERVAGRLETSAPTELKDKAEDFQRQLAAIEELARIKENRSAWGRGGFEYEIANKQYQQTFQNLGLSFDKQSERELIRYIEDWPIRNQITDAIDDWALVAHHLSWRAQRKKRELGEPGAAKVARKSELHEQFRDRLLALGRALVPGSEVGLQVRDPLAWDDRDARAKLVKSLIQSKRKISPQLVLVLASLDTPVTDKTAIPGVVSLLRSAQARDREEFWLNFFLGLFLRESHPEEAIGFYQVALALRPNNAATHNNLGLLLGDQGRFDRAMDHYKTAIRLRPDFMMPHFNLARIYIRRKDDHQAQKHLEIAERLNPRDEEVLRNLGELHYRNNNSSRGAYYFDKLTTLAPNDLDLQLGWAHTLFQAEQIDGALERLKVAEKIVDEFERESGQVAVEMALVVAKAYADHCEYARALRFLDRCAKVFPNESKTERLHANRQLLKKYLEVYLQEATAPTTVTDAGQTFRGAITQKAPVHPRSSKAYYRGVHVVRLRKDRAYLLELTSSDFDPFLRVETMSFGILCGNDDMSPPDVLASRLVFRPPADGTYKLLATTAFPNKTGSYALRVRPLKSLGAATTHAGELTQVSPIYEGKFFQTHQQTLRKGHTYKLVLESETYDTVLILKNANGREIVRNDDANPDNPNKSRIDFTPLETGQYSISATSLGNDTGAYELQIREYRLPQE
ncbi:MAG: protein kinase [Gemmataceae bacterium]